MKKVAADVASSARCPRSADPKPNLDLRRLTPRNANHKVKDETKTQKEGT